ncbi:fungal-specific transcription factor domain-containing protein [Hygrophoropsis aurantiaca]|uniref:Fungal-specific transcription factor domain-containing protein n=1 Tax=Hygrophoropsis aurantiaca TaxID=72124 RepID=A0ACB8ANL6_9AGAM|nr:fungal-specific transcription factor domain-containing protein [Hygrophoropsis aurantiaca]
MQTSRSYYPSNGYPSNIIEITDAYASASQPMASSSMVTLHEPELGFDDPNRKTCSYVEASKPRGPPKAYITGLEDRLEKMDSLLKRVSPLFAHLSSSECNGVNSLTNVLLQLRPEADFSNELGPPVIRDSWKTESEPPRHPSPHEKSSSPSAPSKMKGSPASLRSNALPQVAVSSAIIPSSRISSRSRGTPRSDSDSSDYFSSSESEEVGELSLSRGMKRLTIRGLEPTAENNTIIDSQVRFHGKSSCFKLIEPTRKLREEHMVNLGMYPSDLDSGTGNSHYQQSASPVDFAPTRRPEFWATPSWELAFEGFQDRLASLCQSLISELPPPDLALNLIELFFLHINPLYPLFHQPTFERQWHEGLQDQDPWFACLCLSLFAVASRWSDDPRVLDDGQYDVPEAERPSDDTKWQRAGWKYFNTAVDVHRDSRSLFHPPGLFEVQTMTLLGMFLRGTAFHPVGWLFISIGLRKAQDVGAHRKKVYGNKPSVEEELWKRAFWMLVLYDRIGSAALGRPCCAGEEDFDVELPLEVDDEYWEPEDPELAFQQPEGIPSKIAAFNSYLKLTKIVAYALRTIYVLDRSKLLVSAARPRWQEVLTQLNNAMTEWVDSIPSHLQWTNDFQDPLFANQAATLYTTYYLIQIIVYRPFLPVSLRSLANRPPHSNMPVPCIAICVNAGKCCARILRTQIQRGLSNTPNLICASHMCAAILLMNFWDLKWQERNYLQSGPLEDVKPPLAMAMAELLEDVSVFTNVLEQAKPRWRNAEMYLKNLSTSMPYSSKDSAYSAREDEHIAHLANNYERSYDAPPEYRAPPPEYRAAPPPDYRAPPPPITTYPYQPPVEPSTQSPQFFDFPHVTKHPVPGSLPFWPSPPTTTAAPMAWGTQSQAQSQPYFSPTHIAPTFQPPLRREYSQAQFSGPSSEYNMRRTSISSFKSGSSGSEPSLPRREPALTRPQEIDLSARMPYEMAAPLNGTRLNDRAYQPRTGPGSR